MALGRVWTWRVTGLSPMGDVTPMVRRDVAGIDAERFDGVDVPKHVLDLRPALNLQQDFAAGAHERNRLIGLARHDRAQNVDARNDGAVVVGGPADEGEDGVRLEADDTPTACGRESVRGLGDRT